MYSAVAFINVAALDILPGTRLGTSVPWNDSSIEISSAKMRIRIAVMIIGATML